MKLIFIAAIVSFVLATASAQAAPYTASCSVSPNPTMVNQTFTVTAQSNRSPLYVNITEPGQNFASSFGPFDSAPVTVQFQTPFSGTGSVRVFARNEHNGHILGSAYCSFTVLP
jgi:hypothetical protein